MGALSLAVWTPVLSGLVVLALGQQAQAQRVQRVASWLAALSLLAVLPMAWQFAPGVAGMQLQEQAAWIERFGVYYHLGVDGISFWLIVLTAFTTWVVVLSVGQSVTQRVHQYLGAFLVLSGLMIGVFCAVDGLLFYVFFEATLIPMYLIIGVWGGPNRIYAAFKFFLYTLAGSLLMLAAVIYLYNASGGSFNLGVWANLPLSAAEQNALFFAFLA
ncbi:MAG: proton-conducting transporter membrane subunit, partial [Burkholderiaceae bacterium]